MLLVGVGPLEIGRQDTIGDARAGNHQPAGKSRTNELALARFPQQGKLTPPSAREHRPCPPRRWWQVVLPRRRRRMPPLRSSGQLNRRSDPFEPIDQSHDRRGLDPQVLDQFADAGRKLSRSR